VRVEPRVEERDGHPAPGVAAADADPLTYRKDLVLDRARLSFAHDRHVYDGCVHPARVVDGGRSTISATGCRLDRVPRSSHAVTEDDGFTVPERLPLLEALSWFDTDPRALAPLDMLRRYESGWRNRGLVADASPEELTFIRALVARYGSVLDVPP